jgi:hypothetical protein
MLLEREVDISLKNKEGLKAIDIALKKSQTEMYQILVEDMIRQEVKPKEEITEKRRKSKKLEHIENRKKIKSNAALEIPFTFNKNSNSSQLKSVISTSFNIRTSIHSYISHRPIR